MQTKSNLTLLTVIENVVMLCTLPVIRNQNIFSNYFLLENVVLILKLGVTKMCVY